MSNPTLPPAPIQARVAAIFARMGQVGLLQPAEIYGRVAVTDASGTPIRRDFALLGTIQAYAPEGGGMATVEQEGNRESGSLTIYFPQDGSGLLSEANRTERWIVLPNIDRRRRRVASVLNSGPYYMVMLNEGGTADTAGTPR